MSIDWRTRPQYDERSYRDAGGSRFPGRAADIVTTAVVDFELVECSSRPEEWKLFGGEALTRSDTQTIVVLRHRGDML